MSSFGIKQELNGSGGGSGPIDPTITQHLNNDVYLTMGNTAVDPQFEIGFTAAGQSKPHATLTIPDESLMVFSSQSTATFDFIGTDPGPIPVPIILFTNGEEVRNRIMIIGFGFDDNSIFSFQGNGGDDLDGTNNNANGVGIEFSTGDGGSLGGNAGDFRVRTGSAQAGTNGNAGDFIFDLGDNAGGSGHNGRLLNTGDWDFKLNSSGAAFNILSSDNDATYIGFTVVDFMGKRAVIKTTAESLTFNSELSNGGMGNSPIYWFNTSDTLTSGLPPTYFAINLPSYSGMDASDGLTDIKITSVSGVTFSGGLPPPSGGLFVMEIAGRNYNATSPQPFNASASTLYVHKSTVSNITMNNGVYAIETDGGLRAEEDAYIGGFLGVGTTPTGAARITSGATGGEVTLSAPDGSGLLMTGNSGGITANMQLNTLGSIWSDTSNATSLILWGQDNNKFVLQGFNSEAAPMDRFLVSSSGTQFTDETNLGVADPTTSLVEILSGTNTKVNFSLKAAGSQTADLMRLYDSDDNILSLFAPNGKLSIDSRPLTDAETSFFMVKKAMTITYADGGGSALLFNIVYDTGNVSYKTVLGGYGATIISDSSTGALLFGTTDTASSDTNVTNTQRLCLTQDGRVGFGANAYPPTSAFQVSLPYFNVEQDDPGIFGYMQANIFTAASGTHGMIDGWYFGSFLDYPIGSTATLDTFNNVRIGVSAVTKAANGSYALNNEGNLRQSGFIYRNGTWQQAAASSFQLIEANDHIIVTGTTAIDYISNRVLQGTISGTDYYAPIGEGTIITLFFVDAGTITNGAGTVPTNFASIVLEGLLNLTFGLNGGSVQLMYHGTNWYQIGAAISY